MGLEEKYGPFEDGGSMDIELNEINEIAPRSRKRCEAYQGLQSFLKKIRNYNLNVYSKKTRKS